ncbi:RagB/SusD family nutrient uptake outer membrane protein [Mucilaginibacter endophyticus]|uniref:RagB/SusD family nutrient uptake outer membrane protein n=1 Tax=Mucilaginibacter endophyticus TaxID=2675003 RepID=UPI000E0D5F44|nr:RagB/SusD family nutrient uptake outer membrane protein [Mucilaginibacter endophyticus]
MKTSIHKYCALLFAAITISSCTKVDVPVETELTPSNFPTTPQQFILASGAAYAQLRGSFAQSYWQMQTLSTDEAIMPARAGGWRDGGRYQQLHYHNWNADLPQVQDAWTWGFGTISTCNRIIATFASSPDNAAKATTIAELRATRAMMFFFMMDLYGNIPVVTTFGSADKPATTARKDVFAFIEKELNEVIPNLSTVVDQTTYGRPTQFTAYAILAKMYLNAEVYTGTGRYNDVVKMCDNIMQSGKYALEDDYLKMFYPDNGPKVKEFIFAIPYDHALAQGEQFSWYSLHPALQAKYGLLYRLSNPCSTIPSYYAQFNDPNDIRTSLWLIGKQYDFAGNPIIIKTTKKGLDASYSGPDPTAPVDYQLTFTPDLTLVDVPTFEVGGDELGKAKGIRNNKYYPDVTATDRNQSNDVPVFRYADILLMKAEAILRGATPTNGETALSLINQLRTKRKAATWSSVDLPNLLQERARELNWETWRRNDLIRFGKYEESWGYKTDKDVNKRLFPIPSAELILNSKLQQNTGY